MQEQRSHYTNRPDKPGDPAPAGLVTIAGIGVQHRVYPGRNVGDTLTALGLVPQPYQVVRVNAEEIKEPFTRMLNADDTVTITNVVRGGG
jgi:hypothetical protein